VEIDVGCSPPAAHGDAPAREERRETSLPERPHEARCADGAEPAQVAPRVRVEALLPRETPHALRHLERDRCDPLAPLEGAERGHDEGAAHRFTLFFFG
jgi:hypothetical protein